MKSISVYQIDSTNYPNKIDTLLWSFTRYNASDKVILDVGNYMSGDSTIYYYEFDTLRSEKTYSFGKYSARADFFYPKPNTCVQKHFSIEGGDRLRSITYETFDGQNRILSSLHHPCLENGFMKDTDAVHRYIYDDANHLMISNTWLNTNSYYSNIKTVYTLDSLTKLVAKEFSTYTNKDDKRSEAETIYYKRDKNGNVTESVEKKKGETKKFLTQYLYNDQNEIIQVIRWEAEYPKYRSVFIYRYEHY